MGSEFGKRHSIMLLMRGVFAAHDRQRVAVNCLALNHVGERPREGGGWDPGEGCDRWSALGESSDAEAGRRVNGLRLHVLCDLNGWTAGHRIGILAG